MPNPTGGKDDQGSSGDSDSNFSFQIDFDEETRQSRGVSFMTSTDRKLVFNGGSVSFAHRPSELPKAENYLDSIERIVKPISKKGYGIGGLSAPRFPKDILQDNPAPNAYQHWVAVPIPSRRKVVQRKSVKNTEEKEESTKRDSGEQPNITKQDADALQLQIIPLSDKQKRDACLQMFVGFGASLSVPRFGKEEAFANVGVGSHELCTKPAEIKKAHSFGGKPVQLIPPTLTRCRYQGHDSCYECDEELKTTDYYRSSKKISNPFYNIDPNDRVGALDLDTILLEHYQEAASASATIKKKTAFVTLCRRCYCRALKGESRFWEKSEISEIFKKVRHCSYIHEHNSIPSYTNRTDCKLIRRLGRKEVLMSKYFANFSKCN